jgi:hypothetical protein
MDPFKKSKNHPEENPKDSVALEATEIFDETLEDETGLFSGEVSEIAKDNASENKAQSAGQKGQTQQTAQKKDKERLLATAPKELLMRSEVKQVLLKKKEELESDVQKYKRKQNYHLLSEAIAQLRAVIHQLEELAQAGYEALKEIWLRVVHKFA